MPVPVNPRDDLPSHWLQPVYGRSLRLQNEFSPSATNSFFTASTRCPRRKAFISASAAFTFFTGTTNNFNCMLNSPTRICLKIATLRGLLLCRDVWHAHTRSAVSLRSSLAPPRLLRPFQLTDLRAEPTGTRCRRRRTSGCRCRGPPSGSRTRCSTNCRPDPRGPSLTQGRVGRCLQHTASHTNPNTT